MVTLRTKESHLTNKKNPDISCQQNKLLQNWSGSFFYKFLPFKILMESNKVKASDEDNFCFLVFLSLIQNVSISLRVFPALLNNSRLFLFVINFFVVSTSFISWISSWKDYLWSFCTDEKMQTTKSVVNLVKENTLKRSTEIN